MPPAEEVLYESVRRFEVWDWATGHRGLRLRSNPNADHHSRIEIWFKPAHFVCLTSVLDGIVIRKASDVSTAVTAAFGPKLERGEAVFLVESSSKSGWVVADSAHGREDDRAFHEPDIFDGYGLKPGERDLFSLSAT